MAVDASMRKLKIPPKFMPYMEKHRIYELFHNLGNELAMCAPKDILIFLKTRLERMEKLRDRRIIILIVPPQLDRIKLSHLVSVKTGCNILSRYLVCQNPADYYSPERLAKMTAEKLFNSEIDGWIFADFPNTVEEAKSLIEAGVIPTHSLFLSDLDAQEDESQIITDLRDPHVTSSSILQFEKCIYRLKEIFKSSLKIIKMKDRTVEDLANVCARVVMKMPNCQAAKIFRVVLIGPRGSRRKTLAKLLNKQFNLVHVDMEHLINVARISDNALGDKIRFLDRNDYSYPLRIVFDILKTRLSKTDCIERGYVLTGFPTSVEDFVLLDSIETPPNRVIFLNIDPSVCKARIGDRVVNEYTGSLHSKKNDPNNPQTLTHPDDEACKVEEEIKFYNARVEAMKKYCGGTCFIVDAKGPITSLFERVEGVLMGPSPAAPPRTGKLHKELIDEIRSRTSSESLRTIYPPLTRTEVVPLIDSEELLRRFSSLKKIRVDSDSESSRSSDEGDLITRELNKEFKRSLKGAF